MLVVQLGSELITAPRSRGDIPEASCGPARSPLQIMALSPLCYMILEITACWELHVSLTSTTKIWFSIAGSRESEDGAAYSPEGWWQPDQAPVAASESGCVLPNLPPNIASLGMNGQQQPPVLSGIDARGALSHFEAQGRRRCASIDSIKASAASEWSGATRYTPIILAVWYEIQMSNLLAIYVHPMVLFSCQALRKAFNTA